MYSSLCKASSKFEFKLFWIGSDRIGSNLRLINYLRLAKSWRDFIKKEQKKKATRTSYHGEEKCNQQTNVTLVSLRELDERRDERNTLTVAIASGKTKLSVWCLNLYFIFILQIIIVFFPFMNCSCFRTELRLWLIQMPYGTSIRESKFPLFQYYSIELQCRVMCY